MCGRARCTLTAQQVAQACGLNPHDASSVPTQDINRYRPSYNVAPGAYLPVFRVRRSPSSSSSEGGDTAAATAGPIVHAMKWGLIPSFTKKTEKPDHYRMFNARSESIKEKPAFRRLIPNKRCLVAVEGFYEWKKDGSKKQPYYVHFKDNQPLVFAALYDSWESSEGEILYTFTILTTRASSALEWLHDRMPVIFRDTGSMTIWLNDFSDKHEKILGPCEDPALVWYPVTPAMGKPSFNGPECIKEIQLKPADEQPLSKFFAKKTGVKFESEPEATDVKCQSDQETAEVKCHSESVVANQSKHEHALDNLKEEAGSKDEEGKIMEDENKDDIKTGGGIKREFSESETKSRLKCESTQGKQSCAAKKKGKVMKTSDDKQSSLLSYFAKR